MSQHRPESGRVLIVRERSASAAAVRPPGAKARMRVGLVVTAGIAAAIYALRRGPAVSPIDSQLARLGLAAFIGVTVTAFHKRLRHNRPLECSLERAQTLLALAGALTMMLIDNSIARAFGVAGAASIVRFRTPVDDPLDATVLFLLMGLGMASGVGAFEVAVVGATAVCTALAVFTVVTPDLGRHTISVELVAAGRDFPSSHVNAVFARYAVVAKPCEWSQDHATRVTYRASVDASLSLEALGADLMNGGGSGLESVSWEKRKSAA